MQPLYSNTAILYMILSLIIYIYKLVIHLSKVWITFVVQVLKKYVSQILVSCHLSNYNRSKTLPYAEIGASLQQ